MKARLWVYPWDIMDEGPDIVMGRAADAGFDEVSVSVLYHESMLLLPHNPRRAVYFPEDGLVHFVPGAEFYRGTPLQPVASELAKNGDALSIICEAAASHGLGTVAWVVTLHNARLGLQNPGWTVENAFGDRYPYALCPSQRQVGTFLTGLVANLSQSYTLAAIEVEALYYLGYPHSWSHAKEGIHLAPVHAHLLSLCFCQACLAAANDEGVDGTKVRRAVRSFLENAFLQENAEESRMRELLSPEELEVLIPGAAAYLAVRVHSVTTLLDQVKAASSVPLHGIIGSGLVDRPWQSGIALEEWGTRCDGLTVNCYEAGPPASVEREVARMRRYTEQSSLYIGLQTTQPHINTPSELSQRVEAAHRGGANGIAIYNYGLMPLSRLGWVKNALEGIGR